MILLSLIGLLSFLAGVAVGIVLPWPRRLAVTRPESLVNSGHTEVMATGPRRRTLLVLVIAALAVNAGLGFLQIATRARVEDQARQDAARVDCQGRYNLRLGLALHERDRVVRSANAAEQDLWRTYIRLFRLASAHPDKIPAAQREFYDAVRTYRGKLHAIQTTRASSPYPDPDMCREIP